MSSPLSAPSRRRAPLRARCARLATVALAATAAVGGTGCYSQLPLLGAPDPGLVVVATLNDRGRVALGEALGPNADRVEGTVTTRGDTLVTLAVKRVRYFGGTENAWAGEAVTLPIAGLRSIQERRLNRTRTAVVAGAVTALVLGFILTRNVLGGGYERIGEPNPGPPAGQ